MNKAIRIKYQANTAVLMGEVEKLLSIADSKPVRFKNLKGYKREYALMLLERVVWYKLIGGAGGATIIADLYGICKKTVYRLQSKAEDLEKQDVIFRRHIRTICNNCSLPFLVEGYATKDSQRLRYIEDQIATLQRRKEEILQTSTYA